MTNSWTDIANSTLIVVWGANPAENHPACIAHINRARRPKDFYPVGDPRRDHYPARMIVVDPRKTRTAAQADDYIRIRPGTDIAFGNGLLKYMIDTVEALPVGDPTRAAFFTYLNQTGNGTFNTDGNGTTASTQPGTVPGNSKYTDARFLVKADGSDYVRDRVDSTTGALSANPAGTATDISNFPLKAASVDADANTVYNRMKAHLAPYDLATTADICDCTVAEIQMLGDAIIANSRCSSTGTDARGNAYRATTLLYAMGITQHTCGSANVKMFANLQGIMGNMGRAGGGINALRGIHNVQGSTDMGLLYGNIPGYSGNPGTQVDGGPDWRTTPSTNNAFGKYVDALWGNMTNGSTTKVADGSYDASYNAASLGLQQRGFYNMTLKWFGDYTSVNNMPFGTPTEKAAKRAAIDACFSLWPKGNGDNHVKMFRNMGLPVGDPARVAAAVVWGQNPAVTEPNQKKVREGLYNLDLLVCVDLFENETAGISRKPGSVTFLIPSASHVEKAGSATNSGRVLQWRYEARQPAGNSKDDNELLLRFAKALDTAGAFSHIKTVWDANGISYATNVYNQLYALPYGGYTPGTNSFAGVNGSAEMASFRPYLPTDVPPADPTYTTTTVYGSEWVAENLFREFAGRLADGATIWLYTESYDTVTKNTAPAAANAAPRLTPGFGYTAWGIANRAKSRSLQDSGQLGFHKWGYSWLVNRRVLYNNGEVPGDQTDFFMGPDSCIRLLAPKAMPAGVAVFNYSRWYRTHGAPTSHVMADVPLLANGSAPSVHVVPGRFPSYVEPYETPRPDLAAIYGYNSTSTAAINAAGPRNLIYSGTDTGTVDNYPLVLTTIRCVEHFQGGPITRNNWYNVEIEPEPWIELNSADARAYGIKDGDMVRVITARTDGYATDEAPVYGQGFRARVGVGLQSNQRVAAGVVAIPWHWGEKGLSTGSRANDLTIDAVDANSTIPEFKACLCRIERKVV